MFHVVRQAYTANNLIVNPAVPYAFAPQDMVLAGYLPLQKMMFYAMTAIGGPALNCAQSAILLAKTRTYQEEKKKDPAVLMEPPAYLAPAANGFTLMEMIRFLGHNQLRRFPVYEYCVHTDSFTLVAGKPRDDQHAIVYIPAHLPGMPVAHWSYGGILHVDEKEREKGPTRPYVVYTEYVISHPLCFWRAKVTDSNITEFERERALDRACDCLWDAVCQHEQAFRNNNPGSARATLAGDEHVEGTRYGAVIGSIDARYPTHRFGEAGVAQRTSSGAIIRRHAMKVHAKILRCSSLKNYWDSLFTENDAADMTLVGEEYFPPLKVLLREFQNEDQVRTLEYDNLARMAMMSVFKDTPGNYVYPIRAVYPKMAWAADEDLNLTFPRKKELLARLSAKNELTKENVADVLRRMAAEEKWDVDFSREELQIWLDRTITEVGKATIGTPGLCLNCNATQKTYRQMCKQCLKKARSSPPEPLFTHDNIVVYVGRRPLWSHTFEIPDFILKPDVEIHYRKQPIYPGTTTAALVAMFKRDVAPRTCRGFSAGPIFLSQEPSCYPRGDGTACLAFLVRLGVARLHQARKWFFDWCFELMRVFGIDVLEPEASDYFLSHFKGDKLKKNQDAREEVRNGWLPTSRSDGTVPIKMTGFAKAEKAMAASYDPAPALIEKGRMKPRFICSPNPIMLYVLGRYTHAQTKWLARKFSKDDALFYAGCAKPEDLNYWLNRTLTEIPDPYTIVDDISAMDSNHSEESFEFHRRVRELQFPYLDDYMRAAYDGEELLNIRVGFYKLMVAFVNASGVSDTSYKNSLMCLLIRAFAVLHGFVDISRNTQADVLEKVRLMLQEVYITASGDDGLVRVPARVLGHKIADFSLDRYREVWSWAGFDIKVSVVPPNKWRMATFLAMRPVWAGHRYEWAPEPARRLRGMFWQIDNTVHHKAWARGVATQVELQGRHQPLLGPICTWFLSVTEGPVASVEVTHKYSPFHGYETSGIQNERAIQEFCVDYHVTRREYDDFLGLLWTIKTPYVNFNSHMFHRIFQEES